MKNRPIQACLFVTFCCILASCAPKEEPIPTPQWSAVELLRNQHKEELSEWAKLQLAIIMVESKGNPNAVGSQGDAGLYQMLDCYVAEVNRVCHTDYKHEDAFDPDKAIEIFNLMQDFYNPSKDFDTALRYHNRSSAYRGRILQSLELVERYETIRSKLICSGK